MEIIDASKTERPFVPLCPHCGKKLDKVVRFEDQKSGLFRGHLGYAFACPHCHKVLGFADYSA